jgi:hypothetical protein
MSQIKSNFLTDHADTLAIIGVNIAIGTILVSMWLSHAHRMDSVNQRMDSVNQRMDTMHTMFYDLLREGKK